MTRAKYGSLVHLTSAEKAERWRENNAERLRKYNHDKYLYYKKHPRFSIVCKVCGNPFMSSRRTAKICPKCLKSGVWRLKNTLHQA